MNVNDSLKNFFHGNFEKEINEKMMYKDYKFEYNRIFSYVNGLLSINISSFISYIVKNYDVRYLTPNDVLQFSNFDDATITLCKKIKEKGDKGFKYIDIGRLLHSKNMADNDGALRKYGENHCKTAENIGLLQKYGFTYYLSCLGYILDMLTEDEKSELIARLILKNKLIRRLIYRASSQGTASYDFETNFLSEKTKNRRRSNINKLLNVLSKKTKGKDLILLKNIKI